MLLSTTEARVLGALMEKAETTPEYYPLSLNALVNACNQKSNRDPVLALDEAIVREALFSLEQRALVRVQAEGRVSKFEHRAYDGLKLGRAEAALLCGLLLRGAQTAAELRARADRLFAFDGTAAAAAALDRLAARDQPLVQQLARQPGSRESRWRETLTRPADAASVAPTAPTAEDSGADARLTALEQHVEALTRRLASLEHQIGLQQTAAPAAKLLKLTANS